MPSKEKIIPTIEVTTTTINVKAVDIITNQIVTMILNVPAKKYTGAFTYTAVSNVITPNGDGINDTWKILDGGKTTFAYNAFAWQLNLINRWGSTETVSSPPVGATGFNENSTIWDAKFGGVNYCGVMYYILYMKNCTYDQIASQNGLLNGSITSLCSMNKTSSSNELNVKDIENKKCEISPNPVSSDLKLTLFTKDEIDISLSVTNVIGMQIKTSFILIDNNRN
ncbi:MAG: gliding motility-associated C-terminal domain-containing protein [Bacteroidetes bacterium]|nr:gliding motility-associated C-terminal domain-containing protein [Bacteroidota bacterium]